jgi:alkylation response protein AidB-like acyl-CoA dehydrogenase
MNQSAVSKAKEIADRILAPAARQNDKDARFSSEAIAALGSAGLMGIMLPSEVGGLALGPRTFAAVVATLAEADASAAMVYLMHVCATATIAAARQSAGVAATSRNVL